MEAHIEIGIPTLQSTHRDEIGIVEVTGTGRQARYRLIQWLPVNPRRTQGDIIDAAAAAGYVSEDAWWDDDDHISDGNGMFSYFINPQDD